MEPAVVIKDCRMVLGRSGSSNVEFHLPSYTLESGTAVALTGPSGCGKSTLLNLISGMIRPDSGSLEIFGQDITKLRSSGLDSYRGRTLGFVFQSFNLLEAFTALENVMIGMRFSRSVRSQCKQRAQEALERVGLGHRLHSYPGRLSVGERQRVSIARALVNKPRLLLADEPTGALDPKTAEDIFQLILTLREEEQCTLLFVTHDLELAARLPQQFDCRGLLAQGGHP